MPMLEKAAVENEGKFKLIKLNIDSLPELATALSIKSVPTVFLVHKGNIMDTFTGIPGPAKLKDFIDTAILLESMSHDEQVIQTLMDRAQEFLEKKEYAPAENLLTEAQSYESWRDKYGAQIIVGIAACQLNKEPRGDLKKIETALHQITDPKRRNMPEFYKDLYQTLDHQLVELQTQLKPSEEELKLVEKIEKTPSDLESRLSLAKI